MRAIEYLRQIHLMDVKIRQKREELDFIINGLLGKGIRYDVDKVQSSPSGKVAEKKCTYIADFVYKDKDGNEVVEDVKGFRTDVYKIKKKMMRYRYGIEIQEV